jgi:hypothetical protein
MLGCDVFPGLDRVDPLSSPDDDLIPEKFGPKWFNFAKEEQQQQQRSKNLDNLVVEGEVDTEALDSVLDEMEDEAGERDSQMLETN